MNSSQVGCSETHSQSTEEGASTSSGRDQISNIGQSELNSQASCGQAYESDSYVSICGSNRNLDDLYSLEDINNFLDVT